MKKGMFILVSLIIIFSILCILKDKHKEKAEISNNPYEIFSFYKKDNLDRYIKYSKNNNLDYKNIILRVNIGLDNSFYTNTKEITKFDTLMLVNKYNFVSRNFKVDNLIKLEDFARSDMYLQKECAASFIKMARDASSEGFNIRAISTYRTYEYQENLYNNYALKDGINKADTYSARPGFSEHHTGLAVDIDNIKSSYTNFSGTKEFIWINENAHKYGFILRYHEDKEHITGYTYEAWHYRYVGIKVATYIKENSITFEEYYYEFLDK